MATAPHPLAILTTLLPLLLGACRGAPAGPGEGDRRSRIGDDAPAPAEDPGAVQAPVHDPAPSEASTDSDGEAQGGGAGGWRQAELAGGAALRWRPVGGGIPRNRECELEVRLERGGEPVEGAVLAVRGWMPDHSHGLVRQPAVEDLGGGRYRVTNLLLHMRGLWQLVFEVGAGAERETLVFELTL